MLGKVGVLRLVKSKSFCTGDISILDQMFQLTELI